MSKSHRYYVYITTNSSKKVLYTGMTNDLSQRITEHYINRGDPKTFAGKYQWVHDAIAREKEIKGWARGKKLELIKKENPTMNSLNASFIQDWPPKNASSRL